MYRTTYIFRGSPIKNHYYFIFFASLGRSTSEQIVAFLKDELCFQDWFISVVSGLQ